MNYLFNVSNTHESSNDGFLWNTTFNKNAIKLIIRFHIYFIFQQMYLHVTNDNTMFSFRLISSMQYII